MVSLYILTTRDFHLSGKKYRLLSLKDISQISELLEKPKEIVKPNYSFENHKFLTPLKCVIELSSMLLERIHD